MLAIDSNILRQHYRDVYNYKYKTINDSLELISIEYVNSRTCEKGYGLEEYTHHCRKCQNCIIC